MIVELAYSEHGEGDPPLVLVHGFTGSQLDWTDVVDELAANRRVITFDHRGHGDSTNLGDESEYSLSILVDDFVALIDRLGLEQFDLLGHSMGGMVAMRYALAHQHGLRSLILMDTAAEPLPANDFFANWIALARASGLDAVLAQIAAFYPQTDDARALARLRVKWAQLDIAAFCALGNELSNHEGVRERLGELSLPTTIIVGEHDAPFREPSAVMAAAIAGSHLEVIADAAHSPQEEQPERWLAAIAAHLERI